MTEKYTKDDLLTADKFAKKYGLDKKVVELAIQKLRGLMMPPPADSTRNTKMPVVVSTGRKNGILRVNNGADEIVLAKVQSLLLPNKEK